MRVNAIEKRYSLDSNDLLRCKKRQCTSHALFAALSLFTG